MYEVTRDTVLKWLTEGKLSCIRTPGGHCRIPLDAIPTNLIKQKNLFQAESRRKPFKYCWEFHADSEEVPEYCKNCIVFRSKTRQCYILNRLPSEIGHVGHYCHGSCESCSYYHTISNQAIMNTEN